jgi:hypothetical protein
VSWSAADSSDAISTKASEGGPLKRAKRGFGSPLWRDQRQSEQVAKQFASARDEGVRRCGGFL